MRRLLVVAMVLAWPPAAHAVLPPPTVPVVSYIVADGADGRVLAAQAADAERPIASVTKLMTAYLALRAGALDRTFRVPAAAARIGESSAGLRAGQRISGRALFDALLVPSANDAAETLAIGTAGSEAVFVARMNATARRLGLAHTAYRSPYGLDAPGAHSTARDQLVLARMLMGDARIRAIVRKRFAIVNGRRLPASNTLLGVFHGLDGVKTGHTLGAGWCLAATARRSGQRIFAVALGAQDEASRNAAVASLLDWGFRQLHRVAVVRPGDAAGSVPTSAGGTLPVAIERPVTATIRPGDRLALRYELATVASVPVARGAVEGRVTVLRNGVAIGSSELVAARAVAAPGVLERIASVFGALSAALGA